MTDFLRQSGLYHDVAVRKGSRELQEVEAQAAAKSAEETEATALLQSL